MLQGKKTKLKKIHNYCWSNVTIVMITNIWTIESFPSYHLNKYEYMYILRGFDEDVILICNAILFV